jgi:hypothetical protein
MKVLSRLIILAALLGAGGAAYWYYSIYLPANMPSTAQAPAAPPGGGGPPGGIPVEAEKVEVGAVSRSVTSVGTLFSDESVIIRPEVAGKITEIRFNEGQAIRKGAIVLRLDDAIARDGRSGACQPQPQQDRSRPGRRAVPPGLRQRPRPRSGPGQAAGGRGLRGAGPRPARQAGIDGSVRRRRGIAPGERR